jgi:Na+-translocating ferredoxin:NAD+ oxidoreductase subunit B
MSATPFMTTPNRLPMVEAIDALLPQTQCTKCGTAGCRPYAEAVAAGTPHNRCVPGGADTIAALAALLERPVLMLDPAFGIEPETRRVAVIREAECIGCTKCLQACPVDAIVGAAKLMHTVITDECTGCDLCIPPCPVDCIDMVDLPKITDTETRRALTQQYRARHEAHLARLQRDAAELASAAPVLQPTSPLLMTTANIATPAVEATPSALNVASKTSDTVETSSTDKSRVIAAALARTQLKKAERQLASAQANGENTQTLEAEIAALKAEVQRLS